MIHRLDRIAEAGDVADEDLIRSEGVPVRASAGGFGHPFASALDEIALHFRQRSRDGGQDQSNVT